MLFTYRVSQYYNVSPEEVEGWYNIDFLDRAEGMLVQEEIDRQYQKHLESRNKGDR